MCGRFTLTVGDYKEIAKRFGITKEDLVDYAASYNIAPSQNSLVIYVEDNKKADFFKWGLIPFWAKDQSIGNMLINARAETAHEKPAFRQAFRKRRCLVPADGFCEWKKEGNKKIPCRFHLQGNELFAFAGLWEEFKDNNILRTFTILTTEANDAVKPIHNRIPVIIKQENEDDWLDPSIKVELIKDLLMPISSEEINCYKVSSAVNSPKNNTPDIILPAGES